MAGGGPRRCSGDDMHHGIEQDMAEEKRSEEICSHRCAVQVPSKQVPARCFTSYGKGALGP